MVIFVPSSLINESKISRDKYYDHNICSGLFNNNGKATRNKGNCPRLFVDESKATRNIYYGNNNLSGYFLINWKLKQVWFNVMAVMFVPGFKINESKASRNIYYGLNFCSGCIASLLKPYRQTNTRNIAMLFVLAFKLMNVKQALNWWSKRWIGEASAELVIQAPSIGDILHIWWCFHIHEVSVCDSKQQTIIAAISKYTLHLRIFSHLYVNIAYSIKNLRME